MAHLLQYGKQDMLNSIPIGNFNLLLVNYHSMNNFIFLRRLELHTESSSTKPDLIFMDQIEEVSQDYVQHKNEQCILVKLRDTRVVLTNQVS